MRLFKFIKKIFGFSQKKKIAELIKLGAEKGPGHPIQPVNAPPEFDYFLDKVDFIEDITPPGKNFRVEIIQLTDKAKKDLNLR